MALSAILSGEALAKTEAALATAEARIRKL